MKSLPVRSKEVVTFHSFARKGYALFSALQKEVRIGVLSAATLTTAAPCLAHALAAPANLDAAAADSLIAGDASLKEALVSASRAPMAAQVAARQVISLTKEDLQSAGVTTVNDVLKLAVGIDVRQRGGFGLQTDISIDGTILRPATTRPTSHLILPILSASKFLRAPLRACSDRRPFQAPSISLRAQAATNSDSR